MTPELMKVIEQGVRNDESLLDVCKALAHSHNALQLRVQILEHELTQLMIQVADLNSTSK